MKLRIDSALDIRSVHEAGHAIAAVRNRVAFSYASIERDLLPGTGGHIMVTLPRHDGTLTVASYGCPLGGASEDCGAASCVGVLVGVLASGRIEMNITRPLTS
jgi:hypothetical protein